MKIFMSGMKMPAVFICLLMFVIILFEPLLFEVYAQAVYDRKVDFKTINADIALMSGVVEFEDKEMSIKMKDFRDKASKELSWQNGIENTLDEKWNEYLKDNSRVDSLKKLAGKYKVIIDRPKFDKLKVAKKSVDTYVELLQFQNLMMDDPLNMYKIKPNPKKYPNLVEFLTEANKLSQTEADYIINMNDSSKLVNPLSVNAIVGDPISEAAARVTCGYFGNFKPAYKLPYKITKGFNTYTSAKDKLLSWGYHLTSSYAAASYTDHTRDQNYTAWLCGPNNYRDHANVTDKYVKAVRTNTTPPYVINEQNYSGKVPRGEPNPEILTKIWPYADWAAYVYTYHRVY